MQNNMFREVIILRLEIDRQKKFINAVFISFESNNLKSFNVFFRLKLYSLNYISCRGILNVLTILFLAGVCSLKREKNTIIKVFPMLK
jgi:hypothetical protein